MNRHLLINSYDIGGGINIGTNSDINASNKLTATSKLNKNQMFRDNINLNLIQVIYQPQTFTPTTEVNQLLSRQCLHLI